MKEVKKLCDIEDAKSKEEVDEIMNYFGSFKSPSDSPLCPTKATIPCLQEALEANEKNAIKDLIELICKKGYFFKKNRYKDTIDSIEKKEEYREYYLKGITIRIYFDKYRRVVIYETYPQYDELIEQQVQVRFDGKIKDVKLFEDILNTID